MMKAHFIIILLTAGLLTMTSCASNKQGFNKQQAKKEKEAEKALKERIKRASAQAMRMIEDPHSGATKYGSLAKDKSSIRKDAEINKTKIEVIYYYETASMDIFKGNHRLGSIQKNYEVIPEPGIKKENVIKTLETFAGI